MWKHDLTEKRVRGTVSWLGEHKKGKRQNPKLQHGFQIKCVCQLCTLLGTQRRVSHGPSPQRPDRSILIITVINIKQSMVHRSKKERFCCMGRKKTYHVCNLGTHTINTFWSRVTGGPSCSFPQWHLEHIGVLCAAVLHNERGKGRERERNL